MSMIVLCCLRSQEQPTQMKKTKINYNLHLEKRKDSIKDTMKIKGVKMPQYFLHDIDA